MNLFQMAGAKLPPGFRFHPTDVELVKYHLKRKVLGKQKQFEVISEVELYKFAPWDLPAMSCLKTRDLEWYFFCPRDRKYMNGPRTNRATEIGYWKTTGKDRPVCHNNETVGMKKTLVFHLGRAPNGSRTNWVMHEYRLEDKDLTGKGLCQDLFVLCKIFEKSGPGPKNGEQHGAPFIEEEWDEDDVMNNSLVTSFDDQHSPPKQEDSQNLAKAKSLTDSNDEGVSSEMSLPAPGGIPVAAGGCEFFNVSDLLEELDNGDGAALVSYENGVNEKPDIPCPDKASILPGSVPADGDEIFGDLEDINQTEPKNNYLESHQIVSEFINGNGLRLEELDVPLMTGCDVYEVPTDAFNYHVAEVDKNEFSYDLQDFFFDSTWPQQMQDVPPAPLEVSLPGEDTASPTLDHLSEGDGSYSKLQSLLGSIPARPASAAEYSPFEEDAHKTNSLSLGSPIHLKAEVTIRCACGGHLPYRIGNHSCGCCYGGQASKKFGKEPSLRRGGFMFVFILGMFSALMWAFILAMGAKLGWYAWKNIV